MFESIHSSPLGYPEAGRTVRPRPMSMSSCTNTLAFPNFRHQFALSKFSIDEMQAKGKSCHRCIKSPRILPLGPNHQGRILNTIWLTLSVIAVPTTVAIGICLHGLAPSTELTAIGTMRFFIA